jgi:hypothetical protein
MRRSRLLAASSSAIIVPAQEKSRRRKREKNLHTNGQASTQFLEFQSSGGLDD